MDFSKNSVSSLTSRSPSLYQCPSESFHKKLQRALIRQRVPSSTLHPPRARRGFLVRLFGESWGALRRGRRAQNVRRRERSGRQDLNKMTVRSPNAHFGRTRDHHTQFREKTQEKSTTTRILGGKHTWSNHGHPAHGGGGSTGERRRRVPVGGEGRGRRCATKGARQLAPTPRLPLFSKNFQLKALLLLL